MEEKSEKKDIEIKTLETEALSLPEKAKQIQIVDDETLHKANEFIHICRQMEKKIDETMDPIIKKAHDLHYESLDQKKKLKTPLVLARGRVSPQIILYKRKIEEEIRAREEERIRKIEEENRKKEEAFEKAAALEKAGDQEKAEEEFEKAAKIEEDEAVSRLTPVFKEKTPETKGTSIKQIWKFRLKNFDKVPREWLKLNEAKIGMAVRSSKGKIEIPGIEIYPEDSISLRG